MLPENDGDQCSFDCENLLWIMVEGVQSTSGVRIIHTWMFTDYFNAQCEFMTLGYRVKAGEAEGTFAALMDIDVWMEKTLLGYGKE